jgi:hypothetical protein
VKEQIEVSMRGYSKPSILFSTLKIRFPLLEFPKNTTIFIQK